MEEKASSVTYKRHNESSQQYSRFLRNKARTKVTTGSRERQKTTILVVNPGNEFEQGSRGTSGGAQSRTHLQSTFADPHRPTDFNTVGLNPKYATMADMDEERMRNNST